MKKDIPTQVYEILTKKSYNRDEPFLKDKLKERFTYFIKNKKPIKLVGFWGVGQKNKANKADEMSCLFLEKLNEEVKKIYPSGIEFIFIFANEHGIHNGISKETMNSYIKDMKEIFSNVGFKSLLLTVLWKKYDINFEKIDALWEEKERNENDWWIHIENAERIEKNAANRNLRLAPKIAAQKYYIMRDLEKTMLEKEFHDAIFHAFSDAKLRNVLPHLPTLYFYARKGWSNAPWFVTD